MSDPLHLTSLLLPCYACGAVWVEAPEVGKGAHRMDHAEDCSYMEQ